MLTWVAFIGGPRESRRLLGDVVLTQEDIVTKRDFPDGCVPSTWSIDLHYPKKQYAEKFPDNPFISIAEHDRRVDRTYRLPGSVSLFLLPQHRQPVHGRALHQRDPRGAWERRA